MNAATRHRLVLSNRGLVESIIKRYRFAGIPTDDLMQEGVIGLIRASQEYDPRRASFSTFAFWSIRRQLTAYVRREIRMNGSIDAAGVFVAHIRLDANINSAEPGMTLLDTMESPMESPESVVLRRQEHQIARGAIRWAARKLAHVRSRATFAVVGNLLSMNPLGFRDLASSSGLSRANLNHRTRVILAYARQAV